MSSRDSRDSRDSDDSAASFLDIKKQKFRPLAKVQEDPMEEDDEDEVPLSPTSRQHSRRDRSPVNRRYSGQNDDRRGSKRPRVDSIERPGNGNGAEAYPRQSVPRSRMRSDSRGSNQRNFRGRLSSTSRRLSEDQTPRQQRKFSPIRSPTPTEEDRRAFLRAKEWFKRDMQERPGQTNEDYYRQQGRNMRRGRGWERNASQGRR